MAKKSTKKPVEIETAKVVEEQPKKKSTKKVEIVENISIEEKVIQVEIESNGASGSLNVEPKLVISETLKDKYILLSKSRYELFWKGIKIFDSMTHRVAVEFNDDHVKVNEKMYPYFGIRFNLK